MGWLVRWAAYEHGTIWREPGHVRPGSTAHPKGWTAKSGRGGLLSGVCVFSTAPGVTSFYM